MILVELVRLAYFFTDLDSANLIPHLNIETQLSTSEG